MDSQTRDAGTTSWGRTAATLLVLWFSGLSLRVTLLAIPPIIPAIHRDLGLDETGIGILSALPTLMLAWAAIPGSLLIARLGAVRTLLAGTVVTAIAAALRGVADDALTLDLATLVMGIGIAVMQPTLPPLVRRWMPNRIGFGTSVYTNGWLIAEIVAVWATIPYVLPMVGGSWRFSLVAWAAPVALSAGMLVVLAPRRAASGAAVQPIRRWWPNWRQGLLWRMAFTLGGANIAYWSANAFIPDYLTHIGRPEMIGDALTALNLGQLPVSILSLFLAGRLSGRAWPISGMAFLMLLGMLLFMFGDETLCIVGAAMAGFTTAGVMILVLTLPPLLCAAEDVPRMSAGMFMISYNCSVVTSVLGGVLWDATASPYPAFALIAVGILFTIVLPLVGGGLKHRAAAVAA